MTKAINRAGQEKRITTHPRREARYQRAVERNLRSAERTAARSYAGFMLRFRCKTALDLLRRLDARAADCAKAGNWLSRAAALI